MICQGEIKKNQRFSMQNIFIIISVIFVFFAYLIYEWSIIKRKTIPHRTTRFVLMLIMVLGAISLFAQEDRVAVWLISICAIQSIIVFLLSFKYGMGGWEKIDIVCLLIALIGITIWKLTDNPSMGLYAAVIADFIGMVPTLIKTYRLPHTEYWLVYIFDILASVFTLLAIQIWEFQGFLYPLYLLIINLFMLFLIIKPKLSKADLKKLS